MKKALILVGFIVTAALAFGVYYGFTDRNGTVEKQQDDIPLAEEFDNLNTKQGESILRLNMFNAATGIAVIPEYVSILPRGSAKSAYILKGDELKKNTLVVKLADDTYDISVKAPGYQTMDSYFTFQGDSLNVNFNLEPLSLPEQLSEDFIKKHHKKDATLVLGFVSETSTRLPLGGVKIYSADRSVETKSDMNGFFMLSVPLVNNLSEAPDRGKIIFEKDTYLTEARKNFDMWPEGDLILQIQLNKGSGMNIEDVLLKREASYVTLQEAK